MRPGAFVRLERPFGAGPAYVRPDAVEMVLRSNDDDTDGVDKSFVFTSDCGDDPLLVIGSPAWVVDKLEYR